VIPSRHVTAVLWVAWLQAAVMFAALAWEQPEALAGIGIGFGAAFVALGGSAYARHNGAKEPSGGVGSVASVPLGSKQPGS
jgi:hypothetical protein